MNRFLLIIILSWIGAMSQSQIREIKPDIVELNPMNSDFSPDPGVPLPDSFQKNEAIQFFEGKIENLSGKTSVYNEAMLNAAFEYYQLAGKPKEAFVYGDKLIKYKDYVASQFLKNKLSALKDDHEMIQKENEIQLLNNQSIIYQEKIKASTRQQWTIIGGIGVLLIFVIALGHRVRTIRKTRDLLQTKSAQLQHEKNRAEKSELYKEQFLANVSHEIRTPMNAIMGISNILIKNKHLKPQKKYLNAMHKSAKSLLSLINDILDLSKLEAGKVELINAPFNPREVIMEVYDSLKEKARQKGLNFNVEMDEYVPDTLSGDGTVLSNILLNLTTNAISFTNSGYVILKCSVADENSDFSTLRLVVRDSGVGIVPEKQEKILNTFVKVYDNDSIQYVGSGLELAIISQMIELQGGNIRLESEPGMGTAFFIEIPYRINATEVIPKFSDPAIPEEELKDISVLLVEDNEFNVMVASTELESTIDGLNLDVAENGKVAVEKLEQKKYDIVLMDVQMPVMDGYEATRKIRKMNGEVSKIPILAMTANVLQQEIEKCLKEGMNDYISKPFETDELLSKMRKIMTDSAIR